MCLVTLINEKDYKKLRKLRDEPKKYYQYVIDNIFKVAKKDIICYKIFNLTPEGKLISPYRSMRYDFNTHYYQTGIKFTFNINFFNSRIYIERGLHSYTYTDSGLLYTDSVLVKCIIPKDSLYLISNLEENIVSDNLIITDEIIYGRK